MSHTTLVDVDTLVAHLDDPSWLVVDVRHNLVEPEAGRAAYRAGHIPGAAFLHMDEDLSAPCSGSNGRHPLPDAATVAEKLGGLGITRDVQVVVYDDNGGMMAGRLWWLLRWLGHRDVALLDGGLPAWLAAGHALNDEATRRAPALFFWYPQPWVIEADWLLAHLDDPELQVVDARAPDRFRGEHEKTDPVGGHIPGAINRFFRDNLQADGRFKPAHQLQLEWQELLAGRTPEQLIHQCGSGVTACHNLLALEIAGLPGGRLYAGSWSEWCADPRRPVAR
jgi:thiosulfate/3-mercaptopyruvate sulfurtransferase